MKFKERLKKIAEAMQNGWEWMGEDGLLHLALSAIIVLAFGWLRPIWGAVCVAIAVGLCKEFRDIMKNGKKVIRHSLHDLLFDCFGVCVGLVLVWIYLR